jgi:hypothetical protein
MSDVKHLIWIKDSSPTAPNNKPLSTNFGNATLAAQHQRWQPKSVTGL